MRLYQGKEDQETVYWKDPVEMASIWVDRGAQMLHIADLDGAFQGKPANLERVARMKKTVSVPIQMGGGFRSMEAIDAAFAVGLDRVILGTAAVYNPVLVEESIDKYGDKIAVSIDVSEDYVTVSGWKEVSAVKSDELAKKMIELGVRNLLFTDTRKDGTLSGPNTAGIRAFLHAAQGIPVIVSGGITSTEDLIELRELAPQGLSGIIIGKALYDRKITLADAMKVVGI